MGSIKHFSRGVAKDKTKEVADIAQDKGEEMKEAGALCMKKPSTILKDTGEKLEVVKEAAEKKLDVAKEAFGGEGGDGSSAKEKMV